MSRLATVMTTLGVVVFMACVAPFTRAREHKNGVPESSGPLYAFYAFVGVNLAVFAIGISVAAAATFFG